VISYPSWSVLTVDFLIILHLSLAGVTLSALLHLVNGRWRVNIRALAVSFFSLYPLAVVLLLVLLYGGAQTFPWVGSFETLPRWNNLGFLAAREILAILAMGGLYALFIRLQARSEHSATDYHNFKIVAMLVPFAHVLYFTLVSWDFEMTLLPGWESSIFAMYHFVSCFGMFLSVLVITFYLLDVKGLFKTPQPLFLYNYIAQMMLAFSILWVYTFFAQYLIIWYGNLPEETERLWRMQDGDYAPLFWGFFVLKFVVPFVCLVFPYTRSKPQFIVALAGVIFVGTFIERYTWVAGTVPNSHWPMTGVFDVAVTAAVAFAAYKLLRRALKNNGVSV
jgi:hypothetical protein